MDTKSSIRDYMRDELQIGDNLLADDTPLWGSVIDSVGLMRLIAFVEEQFEIEIEDDELTSAHFGTITGIVTLVDRKVAGT